MDFFEHIKQTPPDPIFGLHQAFLADSNPQKVNLSAGIYNTEDLKPLILTAIKEAEKRLIERETSKDYLPIDGLRSYIEKTQELVFGEQSGRIYGAQTVGGTAALRVGGEFLRLQGYEQIYLSEPTWANHPRIFKDAALKIGSYPYFDLKNLRFDFEGFYAALSKMPPKSIVLLQACCHNPTGFDPTMEQWKLICRRMEERELFPFFDFAYQGFGVDLEQDTLALRYFVQSGLQCAVAVSHSKNFGLYAERTGALYFVCLSEAQAKKVGSGVKMVIRGLYSNPPCHGAKLVSMILEDGELKKKWLLELDSMRQRISLMRSHLLSSLQACTARFDLLAGQLGMFSYTGLASQEVDRLIAEYAIYLPKDGRINVAGLNQKNVQYVVDAIISIM